jgi:hypothetical protein
MICRLHRHVGLPRWSVDPSSFGRLTLSATGLTWRPLIAIRSRPLDLRAEEIRFARVSRGWIASHIWVELVGEFSEAPTYGTDPVLGAVAIYFTTWVGKDLEGAAESAGLRYLQRATRPGDAVIAWPSRRVVWDTNGPRLDET